MPTISQRAIENMDNMVTGMTDIDEEFKEFKVNFWDCSYSYQVQFTTLVTDCTCEYNMQLV